MYLALVAAEGLDVGLEPLERRNLVLETQVQRTCSLSLRTLYP